MPTGTQGGPIGTVRVRPPKRGKGPYLGGSHGNADQTRGKRGVKRRSRGKRGHSRAGSR